MSLFQSINISGTGVDAMQTWINTSAGNIANANDEASTTSTVYAEQTPIFSPATSTDGDGIGDGVTTTVEMGSPSGTDVQDPSNPLADKQGNVLGTGISTADQLVNLMTAQEGYSANTDAMSRAISAYQAGLTIGS